MIAGCFGHVGLRQLHTKLSCTQLMKAYVAETSCNQLFLIDQFHYVYVHQDLSPVVTMSNEPLQYHHTRPHLQGYNPRAGVGVSRLESCNQYPKTTRTQGVSVSNTQLIRKVWTLYKVPCIEWIPFTTTPGVTLTGNDVLQSGGCTQVVWEIVVWVV